ncbi:unnamed protein product [Rotaria sp. Silwood1]|nr:unnamed protein product [Rotaria sp. Silwood1]
MANQSKKVTTLFDRSDQVSSPISRFVFSFLRVIDPYLQYLLLFKGYGHQILSKAGIVTVPVGPKGTVLVAMTAACAVKQIINIIYIMEVRMPYSGVILISIYDTIFNSLASLSSLIHSSSNQLGGLQYVGIYMFIIGIFTELISELQRKKFKDNSVNQSKLYTAGLFSLARHINYGGYTL